jgi:hypothetical protein
VESTHLRHPKHRKAGLLGSDVAKACWCLAKLFDEPDGQITNFWDAEQIADWLNIDSLVTAIEAVGGTCPNPMELVKHGMHAAVEARLIRIEPDGSVWIHNWSEYQRDSTKAATKRKRRQRARDRVKSILHQQEMDFGAKSARQTTQGQICIRWMTDLGFNEKQIDDQLEEWIAAIDKLNTSDGLGWDEIGRLIDYIIGDTGNGKWCGWRAACQTPDKLRMKSRDSRKYWQVIKAQMESTPTRKAAPGLFDKALERGQEIMDEIESRKNG